MRKLSLREIYHETVLGPAQFQQNHFQQNHRCLRSVQTTYFTKERSTSNRRKQREKKDNSP